MSAEGFIQCCICGIVYNKSGQPLRSFSSNDKTICGCPKCKKTDGSLTKINGFKISKWTDNKNKEHLDKGYVNVIAGSSLNPSFLRWQSEN